MKDFFHKQYLWKPFSAKVCQDVRKLSNPHVQSHICYISVGYLMDFSCSRSMNSRWFLDIFSYGSTNSRSKDPWKTLWFSAKKKLSRLSRHSAIIHEVPHYSRFWCIPDGDFSPDFGIIVPVAPFTHRFFGWLWQLRFASVAPIIPYVELHRSRNTNVRSVCLLVIGNKNQLRSLIFGGSQEVAKMSHENKKKLTFQYTGCLMRILRMVYHNPHITSRILYIP